MQIIYYIIHTISGCPDADLEYFKNKKVTCKKCGRTSYIFMRY